MLNKVYTYIRVSTQEQKTDRQLEAILQYTKQNNLPTDKLQRAYKHQCKIEL